MKRTAGNARARKLAAKGISMFPFLAVLVCAMGALIVLLVVITRQARDAAEEAAAKERQQQRDDLEAAAEMAEWRIEQLRASRQATARQLDEMRSTLGHLEEHARRLQDQLTHMQRAWDELKRDDADHDETLAKLKAELARTRQEIGKAEAELADAEKEMAEREPAYAIIPYQGPNQTRRRPIYIECGRDAVILQPEGIELPAAAFEGPMGPGNPLAAVLRAKREYMVGKGWIDPESDGEPYPLLLVRPDGVGAYAAARRALKSWGHDFGYELVAADWQVAFPPADPNLEAELRETLASARARQVRLAAAAPRHRRARAGRAYYRAAPGGGVMLEGGEPKPADYRPTRPHGNRSAGSPTGGFASADGSAGDGADGYAAAGSGLSVGRSGLVRDGSTTGGNLLRGSSDSGRSSRGELRGESGGARDADRLSGQGGSSGSGSGRGSTAVSEEQLAGIYGGIPSGRDSAGGGASNESANPTNRPMAGQPGADAQEMGNAVAGGAAGGVAGGAAGPMDEGMIAPRSTGGNASGALSASGGGSAVGKNQTRYGGQFGQPGQPGSGGPASSPSMGSPSGGGASGASQGKMTAASAAPRPGEYREPVDHRSLADDKGRDWALRGATYRATPIARTIHIDCHQDHLLVAAQPGGPGGQIIPFGVGPRIAAEELVSAVWDVLDAWGLAGRDMYWKPILQIHVDQGAEYRLTQLQEVLADSGLTIEGVAGNVRRQTRIPNTTR